MNWKTKPRNRRSLLFQIKRNALEDRSPRARTIRLARERAENAALRLFSTLFNRVYWALQDVEAFLERNVLTDADLIEERPWREPTDYERALVRALCSIPRPDHEIYQRQVDFLEVRECDRERQLELRLRNDAPIVPDAGRGGVISEAVYRDDDGVEVSFLLHVRGGKLEFLEIYKPQFRDPLEPAINREPPLSTLDFRDLRAD